MGRWTEEAGVLVVDLGGISKFGRLKELAPGGTEGGCWRPVSSGYRWRVKEVWLSSYCVPDAVICFASFSSLRFLLFLFMCVCVCMCVSMCICPEYTGAHRGQKRTWDPSELEL